MIEGSKAPLVELLLKEPQTPELQVLIKDLNEGDYNEFLGGTLAQPLVALVKRLRELGLEAIAQLVIDGKFDATKEEAEAWFAKDGHKLFFSDQFVRSKLHEAAVQDRKHKGRRWG